MARFRGAMAEVVRDFKKGYTIHPQAGGGGHYRILDPEGNEVRDPTTDRVILLSSTAYDGPLTKKLRGKLVKAGVIEPSQDDRRTVLAEEVRQESALLKAIEEAQPDLRIEVEDTFFGPRYREVMPSITLNVSWDEFLEMERVAGFIADKGPRTIAAMEHYLSMTSRARTLMERQVEVRQNKNGVYSGAVGA